MAMAGNRVLGDRCPTLRSNRKLQKFRGGFLIAAVIGRQWWGLWVSYFRQAMDTLCAHTTVRCKS